MINLEKILNRKSAIPPPHSSRVSHCRGGGHEGAPPSLQQFFLKNPPSKLMPPVGHPCLLKNEAPLI